MRIRVSSNYCVAGSFETVMMSFQIEENRNVFGGSICKWWVWIRSENTTDWQRTVPHLKIRIRNLAKRNKTVLPFGFFCFSGNGTGSTIRFDSGDSKIQLLCRSSNFLMRCLFLIYQQCVNRECSMFDNAKLNSNHENGKAFAYMFWGDRNARLGPKSWLFCYPKWYLMGLIYQCCCYKRHWHSRMSNSNLTGRMGTIIVQ